MNNINKLVFTMHMCCVLYELQNEFSYALKCRWITDKTVSLFKLLVVGL